MTAKRVTINPRPRPKKEAWHVPHDLEAARKIEEFLNARVDGVLETISFREIAEPLGMNIDFVRDIICYNFGPCNEVSL